MIREIEHLSYEHRLRGFPAWREGSGEMLEHSPQYIQGVQESWRGIFARAWSDRKGGMALEWKRIDLC